MARKTARKTRTKVSVRKAIITRAINALKAKQELTEKQKRALKSKLGRKMLRAAGLTSLGKKSKAKKATVKRSVKRTAKRGAKKSAKKAAKKSTKKSAAKRDVQIAMIKYHKALGHKLSPKSKKALAAAK